MNKSELGKTCKQANRPMGVYIVRSAKNNMVFIGAGTDIQAKIYSHKTEKILRSFREALVSRAESNEQPAQ